MANLVLFDCPLQASTTTSANESVELNMSSNAVGSHFEYCTALLKKYYKEQQGRLSEPGVLSCDILDIRAQESKYDCGGDAKKSLLSMCDGTGRNYHFITPGTHWSMLFDDNVKFVVDILQQHIFHEDH